MHREKEREKIRIYIQKRQNRTERKSVCMQMLYAVLLSFSVIGKKLLRFFAALILYSSLSLQVKKNLLQTKLIIKGDSEYSTDSNANLKQLF